MEQRRTLSSKIPRNFARKPKQTTEVSIYLKNKGQKKTETQKRTKKIGNKATRTVCPHSFMLYSVSTVFQVARPFIHHIQDKNDFKETKLPAANTSKNKRPQTISQDSEKDHGRFNIPQKQVPQKHKNT